MNNWYWKPLYYKIRQLAIFKTQNKFKKKNYEILIFFKIKYLLETIVAHSGLRWFYFGRH